MNWQNFHSKLHKITMLSQSADNDGQLSKLEKDLLASYIRDLYEILIDEKVNDADRLQNRRIKSDFGGTQAPPQPTEIPIVKEEPKPEESKPIMEEVRVHEENVIKPEPRQEVVVIREEPKPVQETVIRNDIKQDVQEIVQKENSPEPVVTSLEKTLVDELFFEEKVSDLSDKLASQKISDLTKAMGINEKIFTVQELFNNDNNLFSQTLQHLNSLPDFPSAKSYLLKEIVGKLDWTSEKKLKKAATFIKLVRRRFM
ncbi:MAG: hypothetical protein IPG79_16025 [Saprospiraceae bacterium]|nr:hypothetical protein [Saprospiraceae bacterium]